MTTTAVERYPPSLRRVYQWPDADKQEYIAAHSTAVEPAEALSFRAFVEQVNPRYRWYPYVERLARVLERVERGEISRLMIFAPPRHGKSELVSRLFSAWYLYRHPDRWVGITSYSAELAYTFSRNARDNFQRAGGVLKDDARAVKQWETTKAGGFWAAGVGGPITGKGFHLGIIDDPLKNAEDAASLVIRDKQWDWYSSTFYTRQEPDAAIVVIQCMTGDTPVRMADGTEIPLRDIRVGDWVATYDNGTLGIAKVLNHKSNHNDFVYKITMTCGKIVHANERHPFLVEEHGELKWVRLRNLTTGQRIVTVRGSGASGKGRFARPKVVKSLSNVVGIACPIIERRCGQTGIVRRRSIRKPIETRISNIATESLLPSMTPCLPLRVANALSASNRQEITSVPIGAGNCVSIIAMKPTRSGGFCATTAISRWGTPRQKRPPSLLPNTSDFTTDTIASIEPAGIEEVFDLQIDRTENFIANGLVSHNTRWHEDDLSGRLVASEEDEPEGWTVVHLEAVKEAEPPEYPATFTLLSDGRRPGEALNPERYPPQKLERIKRKIGEYFFGALYQQRPRPRSGEMFKREMIEIVAAVPRLARVARYWDKAGTKDAGAYSAGVLMGKAGDTFYVLDVVMGQWDPAQREAVISQTAAGDRAAWGQLVTYVEQEPGSGGKESAENTIRRNAGYAFAADRPTGDKALRAEPFAAQVNIGNVKLLRGAWNGRYLDILAAFPRGAVKDPVDASSGCFAKVAQGSAHLPQQAEQASRWKRF